MQNPDPQDALRRLRSQAERRRLMSAALPPATTPEVQRLVQELQVHQIELEMQFEELLLVQTEAESSRAQYLDLYDFAPVGYCTLSFDGALLQLNLRTGQLLGLTRQELTGRRLALFVAFSDRALFADFLAQLWAQPGQRHTCELTMQRPDGTTLFAQLEGLVGNKNYADAADTNTEATTCRLVLIDVTTRRLAADELAASEARFRATFEQSRDGMLLLYENHFVDANNAAIAMLGRTQRREVISHHLSEFWPEYQLDGRRSLDVLNDCITNANHNGWCRLEWMRHDAQGQLVWDEMSFNPVLIGGKALIHGVWRDITDLKRAQQAQLDQQQQLAQAVLAAEEGERRRIAENLHNGLAQLLYASKLSLDHLTAKQYRDNFAGFAEAQSKASQLLNSAIVQTRTLSHELMPRTLEDFGLEAALQDICADYSVAPLRMACRVGKLPSSLPPHLTMALYRMAQELANNIVKHAHATQASLHVLLHNRALELRVDDNGIGFDHSSNKQRHKGIGMQALLDRVRLLNGTLTVLDDQGTHIIIRLPLPEQAPAVPTPTPPSELHA
jgi:PAS domain S-box-containing protein